MLEGKRLNSASSKISKSDKGYGVMVLSKDLSVKGGSPISSRSPRGCFTFNSVSQNKTPTPQTRIGDGSEVQIRTLAPVIRSLGSSQTLSGTGCQSPQPPHPVPRTRGGLLQRSRHLPGAWPVAPRLGPRDSKGREKKPYLSTGSRIRHQCEAGGLRCQSSLGAESVGQGGRRSRWMGENTWERLCHIALRL